MLIGTASVGPDHPETELDGASPAHGDPGELFIVDQLEVGMRSDEADVGDDHPRRPQRRRATRSRWPRSSSAITEPHPWYTPTAAPRSPWGRAVLPIEMISVLAAKSGTAWPVRAPSLGLFLDLEIRLVDGPVFVDQPYAVESEIVGLGQSRRTESYWTRTTLTDTDTGRPAAVVLLHSGVFKESYAGYPSR